MPSKLLCTFSGKTGDILWSLCTVQEMWRRRNHGKIDFACMPQYASLLPLIKAQPYIDKVFVLDDWICQGSPYGDQPWLPPTIPEGYDEVRHLTYKHHPNGETLADHIARAQMIQLRDVASPFIHVPEDFEPLTSGGLPLFQNDRLYVGYAFNWMAAEQKTAFRAELMNVLMGNEIVWMDLTLYDWLTTAALLRKCKFFLGCRSSNYVLAHGMNKKVLCYEPAGERRPGTFGFRQGTEVMPDINDIDAFVRTAKAWLS